MISKAEGASTEIEVWYRELARIVIYWSNTVRPDIAFVIGLLSRVMHHYSSEHCNAAKHIPRYLNGTKNIGITYSMTSGSSNILGYSKGEFAAVRVESESTSGYIFTKRVRAIPCRSKKQRLVAQCTPEAEYVSLSYAASEAIWLRNLVEDIERHQENITVLYWHNQTTISFAKDTVLRYRTRHKEVNQDL